VNRGASSRKDGDADVANQGIGISPFLIHLQDALVSVMYGATFDGLVATTTGWTAAFPNALGDEGVLLVDSIVAVSGEPVNDDLGVRPGRSGW